MKIKIPFYINILFIVIIIFFIFYVFSGENFDYINHPIFTFVIIITLILLFIIEILDKLIYYQNINFFSKKKTLFFKQHNYLFRLYEIVFLDARKKSIIDHGNDLILELDNDIPSLWLNLFYITIIFSSIYFFAYIFTDFAHSDKEYDVSYKKELSDIQYYENSIPQATLETSHFDENLVEDGKTLFEENCATCHESNGRGNIGPNLTDEYWINKEEKSLYKNIFHVLWYGSKNNPTMRAFGESGEIKGNDIQKIASYVYTINKEPKKTTLGREPQGEKIIWEED